MALMLELAPLLSYGAAVILEERARGHPAVILEERARGHPAVILEERARGHPAVIFPALAPDISKAGPWAPRAHGVPKSPHTKFLYATLLYRGFTVGI